MVQKHLQLRLFRFCTHTRDYEWELMSVYFINCCILYKACIHLFNQDELSHKTWAVEGLRTSSTLVNFPFKLTTCWSVVHTLNHGAKSVNLHTCRPAKSKVQNKIFCKTAISLFWPKKKKKINKKSAFWLLTESLVTYLINILNHCALYTCLTSAKGNV